MTVPPAAERLTPAPAGGCDASLLSSRAWPMASNC